MKKVTLKSLHLINFRGAKDLKIDFSETETTISGANKTGKSTIYNAFLWLLFGKDVLDRKDFSIKRIENGEMLRMVDATVIGVLDVDGRTVTLERALVENWVKPRGQTERVFKGNETVCKVNEVPTAVKEYEGKVSEIIDGTIFKLITNPAYFLTMDWKTMRDFLFSIAGTVSDEEIAKGSKEYQALLEKLNGASFDEFKRKIASRKSEIKRASDKIQPKIDQTTILMPQVLNWEELRAQKSDLEKKLEAKEEEVQQLRDPRLRAMIEKSKLEKDLKHLEAERDALIDEAQAHEDAIAERANAGRNALQSTITVKTKRAKTLNEIILNLTRQVSDISQRIDGKSRNIEATRTEWYNKSSEEYPAKDADNIVCPLYKICCDSEAAKAACRASDETAHERFKAEKISALTALSAKGAKLVEEKQELEGQLKHLQQKAARAEALQKECFCTVEKCREMYADMPAVAPVTVDPSGITGVVEITRQIMAVSERIEAVEEVNLADTSHLEKERDEIQAQIDEVKTLLGTEETIAKYKKEIERLREEGKAYAAEIARLEGLEYTATQFTKRKIEECEERINSRFRLVKFRLFEQTIEGNDVEVCVPLIDGVPYPVANTASQVNAGLDVISVLNQFYGVSAPVFIDGRESVNEIIDTDYQIINLVVSTDKQLVIK